MTKKNELSGISLNSKICIFLPSLAGGGAEKAFLHLIKGFCSYGFTVDLVLGRREGQYLPMLPSAVNIISLNVNNMGLSLFGLSKYLIKSKPSTDD